MPFSVAAIATTPGTSCAPTAARKLASMWGKAPARDGSCGSAPARAGSAPVAASAIVVFRIWRRFGRRMMPIVRSGRLMLSNRRNRLDAYSFTPLALLLHASNLHLVSIVHDFVVAPCGGMTCETVPYADRRFVDRAGLDHIGPFGGHLFRGLAARAHDGDVAGAIVMVIVVACHHE